MDWNEIVMGLLGLLTTYLAMRTAGVRDAKASVKSGVTLMLARGSSLLMKVLEDGHVTEEEWKQIAREAGRLSIDASNALGKPHLKRWMKKGAPFAKYVSEALNQAVIEQAEARAILKEAARS